MNQTREPKFPSRLNRSFAMGCYGLLVGSMGSVGASGVPDDAPPPVKLLKIIDERTHQPVPCEVKCLDRHGVLSTLGHADPPNCTIDLASDCERGSKLFFYPDASSVYYSDRASCPYGAESFALRPITNLVHQSFNAELANLQGDQAPDVTARARAALLAAELADRTKKPSIKRQYELQSAQEFGAYLGVADPLVYDPRQKMFVVSSQLESAVRDFQKSNSLRPTGQINYPTLRLASGTSVPELLKTLQP